MDPKSELTNNSGLEPVGQAVLVQPYNPEVESSLIHVPDHIKRRLETLDSRCIVVAIGPDAWEDKTPRAAVGDKVLVSSFSGAMLRGPWDDVQYRMINGRDIYGKITKERNTNAITETMDRAAVRLSETEEDYKS